MSGDIKISVDGDDGAVVAQNPGIRIVNPNQDLVRVGSYLCSFNEKKKSLYLAIRRESSFRCLSVMVTVTLDNFIRFLVN